MKISKSVAGVGLGFAVLPLALVMQGVAGAEQPPAPPAPTTPTYICDSVQAAQPAVFGYTNCQPYGGIQATGLIPEGKTYQVWPRKGDPVGNIQKFQCSGGSADTPTSIAPKKCTELGTPIPESVAPSPIPFDPPK